MESKITTKEKLSFALANLGNIPVQAVIGSYLLIFYTNVVGLDPAACATLFLVARILDGINDPFVGYCIDHLPNTKMGHFRPPLMIGSILCALNFLLLWFGPLMAPVGKLAIAYVSYLLIGVIFPIMDISLNSLLPVITEDMNERNSLSSLKGLVYMAGSLVFNMVIPMILGDTSNKVGYVKVILVAVVIILAGSLLGGAGMKERVKPQAGPKYGIKDLFHILTMKPVWATFLAMLSYYVGMYMINTTNAYFFTYILGNLQLASIASLISAVMMFPAMGCSAKLIQKQGKKKVFIMGLIMYAVFPLIRLTNVTNVPLLMIATALSGFGMGFVMPLTYGMQADNTDYVEIRTGQRAEGAVASLASFVTKCAMGIGGAIPGYILAAAGFSQSLAEQSASVNDIIIACTIWIPAIIVVFGAIIMSVFYPLTRESLKQQNEQISKLRNSEN